MKNKRYIAVYLNYKLIGEVFKTEIGWASFSTACEKYSGGLGGHDGFDTRKEAEADVLEMHLSYTPKKKKNKR